jgi:coproporphyrinogen III oxidase
MRFPTALQSQYEQLTHKYQPKYSSYEACQSESLWRSVNNNNLTALFASNDPSQSMSDKMERFITGFQQQIVDHIEALEGPHGGKFVRDVSYRSGKSSGGGVGRVLQNGRVFEKAGVNISVIRSKMPMKQLQHMRADHHAINSFVAAAAAKSAAASVDQSTALQAVDYSVCGISLVLHPHNPFAPTIHANYRFFNLCLDAVSGNATDANSIWWFGGGTDLTPTYINKQDATHFHSILKHSCDAVSHQSTGMTNQDIYPKFKKWCDEYFYIPHRQETRGIGGIFFDDQDETSFIVGGGSGTGIGSAAPTKLKQVAQEELFAFVCSCADWFHAGYFPLIEKHMNAQFTEEQKRFQQLRRGRYVEFNLMYDRGTKFGLSMLDTSRTEAILMSLPLTARYEYKFSPEIGSEEDKTMQVLKAPVDWV